VRLERALVSDPSTIENLNAWEEWLLDYSVDDDKDDANVQRAGRLGENIHHYLTEIT
jgi:hypothetical protein